MRLIDADELLELYDGLKGKGLRIPIDVLILNIEDQPTACDIDKVVEQLGNAKDEFSGGTLQEEYYWRGINKAIEIVKKGGADEK